MYKPTKEELLEMGFIKAPSGNLYKVFNKGLNNETKLFWKIDYKSFTLFGEEVFLESKQDIETLIRLFRLK